METDPWASRVMSTSVVYRVWQKRLDMTMPVSTEDASVNITAQVSLR
jgi:hypothetical protein